MNTLILDGQFITMEDVVKVARHHHQVSLGPTAIATVKQASEMVETFIREEQVVYGITTGFGKFSDQYIAPQDTAQLQVNLIRSHACGVGEPYGEDVVRAMMVLRINSLIKGHSGITTTTLQALIDLLNHNILPVIPSQGSLGASGDLAPLSHMALALIGEGEVIYQTKRMAANVALHQANLSPIALQAKEGLALINGTQALTSVGLLCLYDAMHLVQIADLTLGMTMSALRGIISAFDERIALVRPHPGHLHTSQSIIHLLADNTFVTQQNELRVQDAYSLRCAGQVHGASKDAFAHIKTQVETEINSVTDNPLLFVGEGDVISGGNFHGQPLALVFDYLAIAISELANISERRLERLVNPALSNGLPAFLTNQGGLHSGFMIVQYSAASLVSENKVYSHPASIDSIPSSANQEDHVSMGNFAARKAVNVLNNTRQVIQMELLAAAQGVDLRLQIGDYQLGQSLDAIYRQIRALIPMIEEDVVMYEYLKQMNHIYDALCHQIEGGTNHAIDDHSA